MIAEISKDSLGLTDLEWNLHALAVPWKSMRP